MGSIVKLHIKSPSGSAVFPLEVSPDTTVAQLHRLLAEAYDSRPAPDTQTLIFAGKVLKDQATRLRDLIDKHEPFEGPHSFHLVVRKPQGEVAGPARAGPSSSASSGSSASAPSDDPSPARPFAAPTTDSGPAPPVQGAASETSGSSSTHASGAEAPGPIPAQQETPSVPYPYMYINPVYAAAYQAAYAAALAASMQGGSNPMQGQTLGQNPSMGYFLPPMYPPAYQPFTGGNPAQHHGMQMPVQYGAAVPQSMVAHIIQGGPNGPEIRIEGVPQEALGPVAMVLANMRQRRAANAAAGAAAAAAAAPNQAHGFHMHMRQRRPRGITLRISARTILQILVFAMVLYQHFTWQRFIGLIVGGLVLYVTSTWGPLRRALAALNHPPPQAPAPRPAPPPPAAQPAVPANDAAPPPAPPAPADVPAGVGPRPRGMLHELLVLILGFVTSLLPAWNYNPDDAAAFAAAQAIAAREDRERQQQEAALGAGEAGNEPPQAAAVGAQANGQQPGPGLGVGPDAVAA